MGRFAPNGKAYPGFPEARDGYLGEEYKPRKFNADSLKDLNALPIESIEEKEIDIEELEVAWSLFSSLQQELNHQFKIRWEGLTLDEIEEAVEKEVLQCPEWELVIRVSAYIWLHNRFPPPFDND